MSVTALGGMAVATSTFTFQSLITMSLKRLADGGQAGGLVNIVNHQRVFLLISSSGQKSASCKCGYFSLEPLPVTKGNIKAQKVVQTSLFSIHK